MTSDPHKVYTVTARLEPKPPFDFVKSAEFLGYFSPLQGEQLVTPDSLVKAVSIAGQVVAFEVRSTGIVEQPGLDCSLYAQQPISDELKLKALERVSFFLSLEDDLAPFYAVGREDPYFKSIIEELYGLHQVKFTTPFENACWAILTQRNHPTVSRRMKSNIMDWAGLRLEVNGLMLRAFPEADQMAALDTAALAAIIGHGPKAAGLKSVSRAFLEADEEWLRKAPFEEVEKWLLAIKGIGAWSAAFILLRGLGRVERVPLAEPSVIEMASKIYGAGGILDKAAIQKIAEPYGDYQGYWAHYLRAIG